jgi:hypothetical protein
MTRIIWIAAGLSLALGGCATMGRAPPSVAATCEALRPALPVKYHGNTMDAESVANVRAANARFRAACPEAVK